MKSTITIRMPLEDNLYLVSYSGEMVRHLWDLQRASMCIQTLCEMRRNADDKRVFVIARCVDGDDMKHLLALVSAVGALSDAGHEIAFTVSRDD